MSKSKAAPFPQPCVSLDLETGTSGRIQKLGAVRSDTGRSLSHRGRGLSEALARLDEFADGAAFVLGHNLIAHDLPHLEAAKPDLRLLKLPVVDTLRLSPLAFPRNPYHALVKHYQDGGLKRGRLNDPELDSRIALQLFRDEDEALRPIAPDLLAAWHWLCAPEPRGIDRALDELFAHIRGSRRPSPGEAMDVIFRLLKDHACTAGMQEIRAGTENPEWPLAFALAWLSVADGDSVVPPWVRHQFPETGQILRRLRDTACRDPACGWCRERHDAKKELKRWFGFPGFRPEPPHEDGRPMQQAIVEEAMAGKHLLGILPTGTGKSICYQIPALSRYDKTGALTIVISPLVALMADQVKGLEQHGIDCCVTVNGLLSMPERSDALDRVRLGGAGILLISPEQLRSRSVRRALDQREIAGWVLDEAHCLSRWGHDFRPDYRYVGRFIREKAGDGPMPRILCLTATAKPDVVEDILRHFREELGIRLDVFNGGTERDNLEFEVVPTTSGEKFADIHRILDFHLPLDESGGAIVYCATRRQSEDIAEYLQEKEVAADHFHAGLSPERKKEVQQRFLAGELRAIAATNAFGMGIDKPDVRLVVHADIPGSLENYLQEAGRAGRDRNPARCVLLYAKEDVDRQFGLSARSRLNREEIHGILRALRRLDRKKYSYRDVVATAGEILGEDEEELFVRDSATDDTRVRTAVAWLEESRLLTREENEVHVFPSSLRVETIEEARGRLAGAKIAGSYRSQLLRIAEALIRADADQGVTTDELMGIARLRPEGVRRALHDLERYGIASNDTALTAFVHTGVERSSRRRLREAADLEIALIHHMQEAAPDLQKEESAPLHLRVASSVMRDQGLADPLPDRLLRIVRGIASDGRGESDGAGGSLACRTREETAWITLKREWEALEKTARLRRDAAEYLLEHLLAQLPAGSRGVDLLAETTFGELLKALRSNLLLMSRMRHPEKLLDRALLWLHEMEVIRLHRGLTVFRPAMTIRLERRDRRSFSRADYEPLALHYKGQVLQIHVMAEFAERGLAAMRDALRLAMDYFALGEEEFLQRWLPGRDREIGRQTTPESWRTIVESLENPVQQRIVADDRERTNVLVLAGPGSGKTRVLVHRIAFLIRARRENARGILALAYNRHAASDIRRRLVEMIGDDARGVTVLTCHALAMRLAGQSFTGRADRPDDEMFREILDRAVALLRGETLSQEEADERRERLLAGFRWILVDEYQDVGREEYELISALAGRTLQDDARKLTLFAVGDDDQNIYSFRGASVEFIRRFEADYGPKPMYLIENYRSTAHIVEAAGAVIAPARNRMKKEHPIRVNRAREEEPPGGEWAKLDPVSKGRVQILPAGSDPIHQARTVMAEFLRLSRLPETWDWSRCAVIARQWEFLVPVRAFCEAHGIPAQPANEEIPNFWRLREIRTFVSWLGGRETRIVDSETLRQSTRGTSGPWSDLLREAIEEHALETGGRETTVDAFLEWLAEWGRGVRRRQRGLLLLTAHRAKGLEFDHVAILDGGWDRVGREKDPDAPRRLYYVAMTRARKTLTLLQQDGGFPAELKDGSATIFREAVELPPCPSAVRYRHVRPTLEEIDLGFAGRLPDGDGVHRAIAALSPGDPLQVRDRDRTLLDERNHPVGKLARKFAPPPGMRIRSAEVVAIVGRSRELSSPEYRDRVKCDVWEVVVPELIFEPVP